MALSDMYIGTQALHSGSSVHSSVSSLEMLQLAVNAGSGIVRVPTDLQFVTAGGVPPWVVDAVGDVLAAASQLGIKVILEPGQTPADLSPDGDPENVPDNLGDLFELASRFAAYVDAIYAILPSASTDTIIAWEVGNEPNLSYVYTTELIPEEAGATVLSPGIVNDEANDRYYSTTLANAEWYAEYLNATNQAINGLNLGFDVSVIGAGIAHNDVAYMEKMFARLNQLGADIDGFAVHPYTTYDEAFTAPESGRPTDWIGTPSNVSESWDYYYSFQGAIYNMQSTMNSYGYSNADLWITEFGVPSYLGYRNAGEDGVLDQARWYAEAFGVFDSWDNASLKGIMAHMVLDFEPSTFSDPYNAYDGNPNNDGTGALAEYSFGLFQEVNGVIEAKPAAWLMADITSGVDFSYFNIQSIYSQSVIDFSAMAPTATGLTSGMIVLSHDGDDTVTGSAYDDSLFAGNGNDTVNGGLGNDRIFGGAGNDIINGQGGNDDIYGNTGNDTIFAGGGDRIDGGTGLDRVVLTGNQASYSWGDGEYSLIVGNGQTIEAINIEELEFGDGSVITLANGDVNRGNGGVAGSPGGNSAPIGVNDTNNDVDAGSSITVAVLNNDSDPDSDPLTVTQINGIDMQPGWNTWVNNIGLVTLNADNTLTIAPDASFSGPYSFAYTVSDGTLTDTATVSGDILVTGSVINGTSGNDNPLNGTSASETINGLGGNDRIYGREGNDILNGDSGNDVLNGNAGNDTLNGGTGNDNLRGGIGADALNGGSGKDFVSYIDATSGVLADLSNASVNTGIAAGDTYSSIERLQGSNYDDILAGNNGANLVYGQKGDDELFGLGGNDTLRGGEGADLLNGGSGFDFATYVDAKAGVTANLSNTSVNTGDAAGDTYTSIERLQGSKFNDVLSGDSLANYILGQQGDDELFGLGGNDILRGGTGADLLDGGGGRDRAQYTASSAGVTVNLENSSVNTGEATGDTYNSIEDLQGSKFADILVGNGSKNYLWGNNGNDEIFANGGNDLLFGQNGNDLLFGGAGNDRIEGGAGDDFQVGDAGSDVFVFRGAALGQDGIGDFEVGADDIRFYANTGLTSFAGVQSAMSQQGGSTVIDLGGGSNITLYDLDMSTLSAGDFQFF